MNQQLIFTVITEDKTGIVATLSDIVSQQGGNWLDSRMSQLAGEFAGIVHIALPVENRKALEDALNALPDCHIVIKQTGAAPEVTTQHISIEVFGNDRAGIVAEVTKQFTENGINIVEFDTEISNAPHSGGMLFHANMLIAPTAVTDINCLRDKLHDVADTLALDIEWTSRL